MTADLIPSPYDVFARFYDAFTDASDYEAWTTSMLELAEGHGLAGRAQLDLACGTGKSFLPFLRRGFRVTGCDASPGMLAEAAVKAPEATLVYADLRELTMLGRFDLVTCFDDSLNYLRDEDELLAALRGMAANLARNGVALFDLNTLRAYRTTFARDSVTEAGGLLFAWRGECAPDAAPGCLAAAEIDVFSPANGAAPGDGDLYERVTTRHEQRHFPLADVAGLLHEAGLECVASHGVLDDGELVERADEERHLKSLFIARHAKGGVAQ
jgi:SAM-dependent methyltransferase